MSVETNSHNYTNMNNTFSQFVAAEFPKTPSPNPARIPPQTPPAGGKIRRGFAKSFSPENSFGKTESVLKPHALPEYLEGRTPKEKNPFIFPQKIFLPHITNPINIF